MSTSQCSQAASVPSANASFATRTVIKLTALITAWQNRRALYRLGGMSDHELSDIGLTRSDLLGISYGALTVDPTARLGTIARRNCEAAPHRLI